MEENSCNKNTDTKVTVSRNIEANIQTFRKIYKDCADIKTREMYLGAHNDKKCFMAYIEVALDMKSFGASGIGMLVKNIEAGISPKDARVADVTEVKDLNQALDVILVGNVLVFVDGCDYALKIGDKGYPSLGVKETDSEKVIRGSNEGFSDSIKINTALVRRRIRSQNLKVKETTAGVRSNTTVDIMYMKDIAYPQVVTEIMKRLAKYEVDGVLDSGVIEQLAEKKWYSPFPEFQTTQRPDRAAMAVLEGGAV